MHEMTPRKIAALRTIADFIDENGYCPSVRDVMHAVGHKSPSTTKMMLDVLEYDGYVTMAHAPMGEAIPRSLRVTDKGREALDGRT